MVVVADGDGQREGNGGVLRNVLVVGPRQISRRGFEVKNRVASRRCGSGFGVGSRPRIPLCVSLINCREKIARLVGDPSPTVRYHAAIASSKPFELVGPGRVVLTAPEKLAQKAEETFYQLKNKLTLQEASLGHKRRWANQLEVYEAILKYLSLHKL